MKKKLILLLVLGVVGIPIFSQSIIKGKIVNSKNQPVDSVLLYIYKLQDTNQVLIKKETNQADGSFVFSIQEDSGSYCMMITHIANFEDQKIAIWVDKDTTSLGNITLSNNKVLDEITISTNNKRKSAIEVLADKTIFNVSENIGASGLNGLELLRKTPGVFVDKDDNIKLKGLSGVQIYIDGRPSYMDGKDLANYLKSINSNDIESIELMSNPSSAYDAQGQAGIINIKFKKDAKRTGLNGSVFIDQGISLRPKYRMNTGASLNYRTNNFLAYGSYSFNLGNYYSHSIFHRIQGDTTIANPFNSNDHNLTHNFNAGIEFYLKKNHSFSLTIKGNFDNGNGNTTNTTSVYPTLTPDNISYMVSTNQTSQEISKRITPTIGYFYKDGKDNQFSVQADYSYYNQKSDNYVPNIYFSFPEKDTLRKNIFRQQNPNTISIFTTKADIVRHLPFGIIDAGLKFSTVNNNPYFYSYNITDNIETLNSNQSNHFLYQENIYAAYIEYGFDAWKKKLAFKFGLRDELTQSNGTLKDINSSVIIQKNPRLYNDLFPSASIKYDITSKHSISAQYSRRIDRPSYGMLNPFIWQLDELTFVQGNPFLQPAYINKVSLTYLLLASLNFDISYTRSSNYIAQVIDSFQQVKALATHKNIGMMQQWNFHAGIPVNIPKIQKYYTAYIDFNVFYSETIGNNALLFKNIYSWGYSGYMEHNFNINSWFDFQLSGWIANMGNQGGLRLSTLGSLDCAIKKNFLKDKLTVKLSFQDLLNTQHISFHNVVGVNMRGINYWDSRRFGLNIAYKFGSNKIKGSTTQNNTDVDNMLQKGGGFSGGK